MKKIAYISVILMVSVLTSQQVLSQNCNKFHLYGTCMQYPGASYKMDGQSRSNIIGIGDKLLYNVVFYGERDYKLVLCATELFNPVHYVLYNGETRELIYDSKNKDYSETVELSIDKTSRIMVEISVLGLNADKKTTEDFFGCVGLLMYYKPIKK